MADRNRLEPVDLLVADGTAFGPNIVNDFNKINLPGRTKGTRSHFIIYQKLPLVTAASARISSAVFFCQ